MSGIGPSVWSTCKGCNTHEWNHVLEKAGGRCRTCGRPAALHKPKCKKGNQSVMKEADNAFRWPG
eukprot:1902570-Pyramimonas_sp.AAC.1